MYLFTFLAEAAGGDSEEIPAENSGEREEASGADKHCAVSQSEFEAEQKNKS